MANPLFSDDQIAKATQGTTPQPDKSVGAAPYIAAVGGPLADLASTLYKSQHGYTEGNPLFGNNLTAMGITKGAQALLIPLLMRQLASHGHPTAAKSLGWISGASGAVPAAINMSHPNLR